MESLPLLLQPPTHILTKSWEEGGRGKVKHSQHMQQL